MRGDSSTMTNLRTQKLRSHLIWWRPLEGRVPPSDDLLSREKYYEPIPTRLNLLLVLRVRTSIVLVGTVRGLSFWRHSSIYTRPEGVLRPYSFDLFESPSKIKSPKFSVRHEDVKVFDNYKWNKTYGL